MLSMPTATATPAATFLVSQIEVRDTKEKGRGVFATGEIEGGSPIGDYLGIVFPTDEGEKNHENDAVYDMWYSDEADVCPEPDSIGIHLVNCSCEPNCAMTAIGRHTIIFALRKIFPGEELTYDYFMGEQEEDCDPGTDNCHCGSDFCRGTMYSNPKAYDEWDEYLDELIGDTPEKPPVPYGQQLPPLEEYPKSIDDHQIYPIFGYQAVPPHIGDASLLQSATEIRTLIRETGKQILIPDLGVVIEGVLFHGHIALRHANQ